MLTGLQTQFSFANKLKSLFGNLANRKRGPWQLCQSRIEESTAATSAKPPVEHIQKKNQMIKRQCKIQNSNKREYCRHWPLPPFEQNLSIAESEDETWVT